MFTYPKKEKLKSHTTINELFMSGKSVSKYPLRMVYVPIKSTDNTPLSIGVSVSKKHFKKAVDRNYYKRLLRESYRLNKQALLDVIDQPYAIMFFYQTKDRLDYAKINEKMEQMIEKFKYQIETK
ncbi:ribonuclease P protein component [Myroides pelagicus]|uniref:Ribonuclease P protein component n=1 Tax=Myroides pelagicus TaxID=270914 RepID=A0A7K1GNN4_9FLAO|nr:ribonuclease P protein component [Myroides pelagicus]MEC4113311.1 ribonuclease P protein component [Myroides pelagicus]MTH30522.1 ribonuclease P protein component [Myroides pelagicus]